jgi:2-amino-4-hydroxy-6-hydroxymethyldihydropteridine diphosphokinase
MRRERAFVALGANVGRREDFLRAAVAALRGWQRVAVGKASRVYETSPVGPKQKDFLNAALELRTALPPEALLAALKRLEDALGRKARGRWAPREIDLDLIYHGARRTRTAALELPHPRRLERKFVLRPLADVAPGFRDPVARRAVKRLLDGLTAPSQKIKITPIRLDPGSPGPRRKRPGR